MCSTRTVGCSACSLEEFDPICVNGKITFFTPCHGGCNSRNASEITQCNCVETDVNDVGTVDLNITVETGTCPFRNCVFTCLSLS